MATRAHRKDAYSTTLALAVASGQVVTAGLGVVFASDTTCQVAGASDLIFGIARTSQTAGQEVVIDLFGPIIPVKVGTGGATRGTKAKHVTDGFTDATAHNSDGTGNESTYGIFLQSGLAGDIVGMVPGAANRGV
jgi:hypothetical protein